VNNNPDQVLNVYGYREEFVPRKAPQGQLFYIVTPNPTIANRKYFYRFKRNEESRTSEIILAPFRERCIAFDNVELASSFCKFIRDARPDEKFYVVLEAGSRENRW
jgi:hypothetical protein